MKKWCAVVIPAGMGHARNVQTVLDGDFIIVLGGAAGTCQKFTLSGYIISPF